MVDVGKYTVRPMDSSGFWEPSILSDLYSFSGRCKRVVTSSCPKKQPTKTSKHPAVPRTKIMGEIIGQTGGVEVCETKQVEEKTHPPISGWKWK